MPPAEHASLLVSSDSVYGNNQRQPTYPLVKDKKKRKDLGIKPPSKDVTPKAEQPFVLGWPQGKRPDKWYFRNGRLVERLVGVYPYLFFLFVFFWGFMIIPLTIYLVMVKRDATIVLFWIAYYTYRYFKPAKEWDFIKKLNRHGARYTNEQAVVLDGFTSDDLKANDGRLFAIHPHGILMAGYCVANSSPILDPLQVKFLTTEAMMNLPFVGDYLAWNGCYIASKQYMQARMSKRANLALLPGGFEESTLFKRGAHRVFIKQRAGFIKYSLEHGYKVHPVYAFGEEYTFYAFTGFEKLRFKLNKYKLPGVLFMSELGLLPHWNNNIYIVCGPAIQMPTIPNPTAEDVEKWHQIYMKHLQELFDRNKAKYARDPDAVLEMW